MLSYKHLLLINVWLDLQLLWWRGGMMARTTRTQKKMELCFPFKTDSFLSLCLCSWVWQRWGWQCCSVWAGSPLSLVCRTILDIAAVLLSICWHMACIDSLQMKPATQRVSGFPLSVISLLSSLIWHPRHHKKYMTVWNYSLFLCCLTRNSDLKSQRLHTGYC